MKQVQKLSDHDIFKIGFGFDKYIRWEYLKTIINNLITSKINDIPTPATPTLQEVTNSGDSTTKSINVDSITTVNGITIGSSALTKLETLRSETIVQDSTLSFTINGVVYKVASTTQA